MSTPQHLDDPTCPRGGGWIVPAVFLLFLAGAMAAGETATFQHRGWLWEGPGWMNAVLFDGFIRLTGWKILGFVGAGMFAARWFVQAWHRKRHGNATMPTLFWIMSLAGAGLTTMYFIFGKNDSVGILQNALPAGVSAYNLWLDLRQRGKSGGVPKAG